MWAWQTRNPTERLNLSVMNEHILLGAPVIDHQHQGLFLSFRKLAATGEVAFPKEAMSDVLSDLTKQIHEHFRTEEAFMLELGLPNDEYQAHLAAHNSIIEELAQIHLDAMYGKYQALPEVIGTVANWVQQHLVEFDLALKPYIAGQAERDVISITQIEEVKILCKPLPAI